MAEPDTEHQAERGSKRRPWDGSHAWLGLLVVIACAGGCAVAIAFAVRRWLAL